MNPLRSCPEPEVLEQFLKGELDQARAEELREHLASCGLCTLLAERLGEFHAIEESSEVPGSAEWDRLQPVIDERFRGQLQGQGSREFNASGRLVSWFSRPALAWCVVLLLTYPAWLGVTRRVADRQPARVRGAAAQFLDLNAARDGNAAPVASGALRPDTTLVLGFFAAVQPGRTYMVSLVDRSGASVFRDVAVQPNDDKGNFFVECDSSLLSPGSYVLTLRSDAAASRQFEFNIR